MHTIEIDDEVLEMLDLGRASTAALWRSMGHALAREVTYNDVISMTLWQATALLPSAKADEGIALLLSTAEGRAFVYALQERKAAQDQQLQAGRIPWAVLGGHTPPPDQPADPSPPDTRPPQDAGNA
jgi:hypothetical protein